MSFCNTLLLSEEHVADSCLQIMTYKPDSDSLNVCAVYSSSVKQSEAQTPEVSPLKIIPALSLSTAQKRFVLPDNDGNFVIKCKECKAKAWYAKFSQIKCTVAGIRFSCIIITCRCPFQ